VVISWKSHFAEMFTCVTLPHKHGQQSRRLTQVTLLTRQAAMGPKDGSAALKCSNQADPRPTLTDLIHSSDLPQRLSLTFMRLVCIQKIRGFKGRAERGASSST
jgi:hypothetical protein